MGDMAACSLLDLSGEGLPRMAIMIANHAGHCYPDLVSMRPFVTTCKLAHRWYYCDFDPPYPVDPRTGIGLSANTASIALMPPPSTAPHRAAKRIRAYGRSS